MNEDFNSFLDSLANDPLPTRSSSKPKQTYPCGQCAGTGMYQGVRIHQPKEKCFACRGTGYFTKSPEKRAAAKARRDNRKQAERRTVADAYEAKHPLLVPFLRDATKWSQLAIDLLANLSTGREPTERQEQAAYSMLAKHQAREQAKQAERKQSTVEVDLAPIRSMFETAVSNGYKKPCYRAEGLVINRAPDTGNNPGALYVKDEQGTYMGKILGTTFTPNREGREGKAADLLNAIAADPLAAALRYGQRTGRCSCCGRELTRESSINAGIGPICAEKWGL
jgi:hypothetical protein